MTIGIAYRVPGVGAVLAADGRVTTNDGTITSDHDDKTLLSGQVAAVFAGTYGGLVFDLRATPPRNWLELRKAVFDIDAELSHAREYEVLAYDKRADALWYTDHGGDSTRYGLYGAVGCGAPIALGVLDASAQPKTLEAAARLVRRAVKITCRRQSACGGRILVLIVPRRGR